MTTRPSPKRKLAETLSALLVATALIAPAPAVFAADAPTKSDSKSEGKADVKTDKKSAENPCGPANPCGPSKKKKKKASDNPCAPGNPCAPKKS
jgi:uncharacterized low-complexity protein